MAERANGANGANGAKGTNGSGARAARPDEPHSVEEARRELDTTRRRMSGELDEIEARLRRVRADVGQRLHVLEPARERIRSDVWKYLAIAFGAGLTYGFLTRKRGGRRGFAGEVLHSTVRQLPGALFTGVRAGVADRIRQDWEARALPPA